MTETTEGQFRLSWQDSGREPQCPPNPRFPKGQDVDLTHGAPASCQVKLPYPAPRCGTQFVHCTACGTTVALTTAGRPDDARSVRVACKPRKDKLQ